MSRLVAAAIIMSAVAASPTHVLDDGQLRAVIGVDVESPSSFGTLMTLSRFHTQISEIADSASSLWSANFVTTETAGKPFSLDSRSYADRLVISADELRLELLWSDMDVCGVGLVNVTLLFELKRGLLEYRLRFASHSKQLGLWDWTLRPAAAKLQNGSATFENSGFGVLHSPPKSFSGVYPQKTMQFMAALSVDDVQQDGVYFGAHDPAASHKTFHCDVDGSGRSALFSLVVTPPNAGLPLDTPYTVEYGVVLGVFRGDWWDAADMYRSWALAHATWTKQGPLRQRGNIPQWLYSLTTWVNSHWQGNDIFNVSGGDPVVLLGRISDIKARFDLESDALALHWYEWDTLGYKPGSNYSQCATEVTCGFDTHYPEYFPVRNGFEDSLQAMQRMNIRVAPYINGRIFDVATASWTRDTAEQWASKTAEATLNATNLSTYKEQYGSKAEFNVMCPHTAYWQDTIANTVGRLVHEYGTDGVYIDQIAAAGPKLCWDPSHNHTLGGGSHWTEGYNQMLDKVRVQAGNDKLVLTESNAEPFMKGINLYLSLVAFYSGDLPSEPMPSSGSVIVPAFQAVYGGYVLSCGAEFFQADFEDPDVFAAKVAVMYIFGTQLGWFSLGGRDNQDPPMGIYENLMNSKYDAEVDYLRYLSRAKRLAAPWFHHGRAMRSLQLKLNVSSGGHTAVTFQKLNHPRSSKEPQLSGVSFGSVMSSAWLAHDGTSLLVTVTTVQRHVPAQVTAELDLRDYGFPAAVGKRFALIDHESSRWLGVYDGVAVRINVELKARDVALLRIQEVPATAWV
eukprot:TRINITY_DN18226_c0_g1_i1.p1 TRINITY_DN18226_c0_g1~~TRINITY_DN18226_c0_g1_i1.p1  ORF type:complete len:794 (+),score=114.91 TRINITY_DN18226_c0_g1_i1:108-2489(+)